MIRVSTTEFMIGLVAGALVAWIWGDQIRQYADEHTRGIRTRAADRLQSMQEKTEGALDTARDQIKSTLQAGQEAVRPRLTRVGS